MKRRFATLLIGSLFLAACSDHLSAPIFTAQIVSIVPAGGAVGVAPNANIVVTFSRPMQQDVEQYAALHDGDVTGPVVSGSWAWSNDHMTLTFTAAAPLASQHRYTVHLGGGMRAMDGGFVDFESCVGQYGGQWATAQMMGSGMMGGGSMMGSGWRHPNGSYGMVFTFTTA